MVSGELRRSARTPAPRMSRGVRLRRIKLGVSIRAALRYLEVFEDGGYQTRLVFWTTAY